MREEYLIICFQNPFRAVVTTRGNIKNFAGPVKHEENPYFNSSGYLFYRFLLIIDL